MLRYVRFNLGFLAEVSDSVSEAGRSPVRGDRRGAVGGGGQRPVLRFFSRGRNAPRDSDSKNTELTGTSDRYRVPIWSNNE